MKDEIVVMAYHIPGNWKIKIYSKKHISDSDFKYMYESDYIVTHNIVEFHKMLSTINTYVDVWKREKLKMTIKIYNT